MSISEKKQTTLETVFPVSISEKDCRNNVKPVVIFNFMQDIAANSINTYDKRYSCEELLRHGQGWFLIRYRIEFDDYQSNIKELKVCTECRGAQKMTTYRDFEVFDNQTGAKILKASSSWFIIDMNKKSVLNIWQEYPEFLKYEKRDNDIELRKLHSINEFDTAKIFHVRYDDLDINNHVNNTVYIAWALEALDYDFRILNRLKSVDIYFKHEAKYGDDITSLVKYDRENSVTEHLIKNAADEELCLLRFEWCRGEVDILVDKLIGG